MNEVETVITKTKGDLTNDEFCRQYWNEKGRDILLGAQIVNVEYMSKKETEEMGWYEQPVCLLLKKGDKTFWVYPSKDDEGNDGGALFMSNKEGVMPTLR